MGGRINTCFMVPNPPINMDRKRAPPAKKEGTTQPDNFPSAETQSVYNSYSNFIVLCNALYIVPVQKLRCQQM